MKRRFVLVLLAMSVAVMACSGKGRKEVDAAVTPDAVSKDAGADQASTPDATAVDDVLPGDDVQNPGACCDSDDECTPPLICLGSTGGGMLGTCQPKPNGTICYGDDDCPDHYGCTESHICTCDMNCMTESGTCRPEEQGCCAKDEDCPESTRCVGTDDSGGVCLPLPAKPHQCWTDVDCEAGESCLESEWCDCSGFCGGYFFGYCQAEWLADCVAEHSGCECYEGCMDGFTSTVYYPEGAGEFAEDIEPPAELLAVAVARYDCGVCGCTESWQVPMDGEWVDFEGGPEEFCIYLKEADESCGGCLTKWVGGCC